MNIDANIITAMVAVVGIIIGAFLQYKFGNIAESSKQYQNLKIQAYVDFIKSAAGIAIAQKLKDPKRESDALTLMADAKTRITVYGSGEVVDLMADFFRNYGSLDSPEAFRSFVSIVQKMRAESINRKELMVNESDMNLLLFGRDI